MRREATVCPLTLWEGRGEGRDWLGQLRRSLGSQDPAESPVFSRYCPSK
jgi:hypothetical protein